MKTKLALCVTAAVCGFAQIVSAQDKVVIRFGHFPNITHAQGVIAHALSRKGKGWFEERLGPKVEIQWFTYNAGPSAMEAMFAGSLDLTYVGQGPALNAHFKSNGQEVRVIAGAANAGAALVVKSDSPIKTAADFRGKKIATPQLGNTQDVSCRAWLKAQGFKITQTGGDVMVLPTANPELTDWIQKNPDEAQKLLIDELAAETRTAFAPDAVAQAWKRIKFTTAVPNELIAKAVQDGKDAGFLKGNTDTSKLIETP